MQAHMTCQSGVDRIGDILGFIRMRRSFRVLFDPNRRMRVLIVVKKEFFF
jgi:hypothetical protein